MYIQKHIYIRQDQAEFLEKEVENNSEFVRQAIDKKIIEEKIKKGVKIKNEWKGTEN